ncbi:MAG: hypothetical protein VX265_03920 [Myxococcota bacterium]|nr:hypothetical protein [Myxococcota bacterium]
MTSMLVALGLWGCGEAAQTASGEQSIDNWLPLDGEGAWTWRDDGADTAPDERTLLHGRDMGQGRIEIRRGARWADADIVGGLRFSTADGLELRAMDLAGRNLGGRPRLLAPALVEEGAVVSDGSWRCDVTIDEEIDTFYALFDRTLVSTCEGNQLPGGTWVFAEGMGLVAIISGSTTLDLVAPW